MRTVPSVLDLFSRRLAIPRTGSGLIGTERVLASVRVVLALSALLLLLLTPEQVSSYGWALVCVLLYVGHSGGLLVLLNMRERISPRLPIVIHAVDVVWPAVMSLFASGTINAFFLYFVFALLAAAFRWGMRETALTTVAVIATMALDVIAHTRAALAAVVGEPSAAGFVMRCVYLLIFCFLIGYLAESEKRRAAEALSVSDISARVRVEAGLKGTVQTVMQEILHLFGARELLVITREAEVQQVMLWRAEKIEDHGGPVFTWRQLDDAEQQEYLCVMDEDSAGAVWRNSNTSSSITLDKNGVRTTESKCSLSSRFAAGHPFRLLLVSAISAASDVSARVLLFEPRLGGRPETQL